MVWGKVSLICKSNLVTVNGNLNARRYRDEILAEQVEPHFDDHALADPPIFMHDGATPHIARISMAVLRQSAMEVLPWPSLSPDLNPIEHVWDYIRRHLNEMDPRVQSMDELREAIYEVWRYMPQQYVRRLIHSMRRRVAAVFRQMVAPHITDCYSVIIVKFLFVYLSLRDVIVIYRFLSLYTFTQINKLIAEGSYCSYRFSVHFLLDCLRYSASCTKSGNFWTLRLGTLENNHNTPALSISFQFCRTLTKHVLYHIANFYGGTQCVIWGVICIFM